MTTIPKDKISMKSLTAVHADTIDVTILRPPVERTYRTQIQRGQPTRALQLRKTTNGLDIMSMREMKRRRIIRWMRKTRMSVKVRWMKVRKMGEI